MKLTRRVKPISYLKSHTADVLRAVVQEKKTLLITHHGEVKLVIQGIEDYEAIQESLALLKILALGEEKRQAKKFKRAKKTFADLRERIKSLTEFRFFK